MDHCFSRVENFNFHGDATRRDPGVPLIYSFGSLFRWRNSFPYSSSSSLFSTNYIRRLRISRKGSSVLMLIRGELIQGNFLSCNTMLHGRPSLRTCSICPHGRRRGGNRRTEDPRGSPLCSHRPFQAKVSHPESAKLSAVNIIPGII